MDDYIKRCDAIEALGDIHPLDYNGQSAKNRILKIPAADVRPVVRGRWKLHDDGSGTCSVCGFRQKAVWDMDNAQNYCGHCGADMREEP